MKILCIFLLSLTIASTNFDPDVANTTLNLNCTELSEIRSHCVESEFCDQTSNYHTEFICNFLCKEVYQRLIQKCFIDQNQFYTSLPHLEAVSLYAAFSNYISSGTFNFGGLTVDNSFGIPAIIESEIWNNSTGTHSNYQRGWGTLINNTGGNNSVAIHVNHPLHDGNTTFLSGYIYNHLNPEFLIIAGAHRYSLVDDVTIPACPNTNENCGDVNYGADVAKYIRACDSSYYTTPFQVYHEVLSDMTDELFSLSVHGFDRDEYPGFPTFLLTNGNSVNGNDCIPPDPITATIYQYLIDYYSNQDHDDPLNQEIVGMFQNECNADNIAVIVQQEINCLNQPTTCASLEHSPYSQLAGIWNPQGRYTNGYYDSNINVGDSLIQNDDTWLQIEISDCIRDSIDLYHKTAEIIADAIQDCKVYGNCQSCNETTPCSDTMGVGVDYGIFEFDCTGIYSIGDVNFDGTINVTDIINMVNHILEIDLLDDDQLYFADINGDGIINIVDIVYLVQII